MIAAPVATPRAAPVVENNTRAPPPSRKSDTDPPTSVVVLGDSMADWLARTASSRPLPIRPTSASCVGTARIPA